MLVARMGNVKRARAGMSRRRGGAQEFVIAAGEAEAEKDVVEQ
jgi:hypothetical protein